MLYASYWNNNIVCYEPLLEPTDVWCEVEQSMHKVSDHRKQLLRLKAARIEEEKDMKQQDMKVKNAAVVINDSITSTKLTLESSTGFELNVSSAMMENVSNAIDLFMSNLKIEQNRSKSKNNNCFYLFYNETEFPMRLVTRALPGLSMEGRQGDWREQQKVQHMDELASKFNVLVQPYGKQPFDYPEDNEGNMAPSLYCCPAAELVPSITKRPAMLLAMCAACDSVWSWSVCAAGGCLRLSCCGKAIRARSMICAVFCYLIALAVHVLLFLSSLALSSVLLQTIPVARTGVSVHRLSPEEAGPTIPFLNVVAEITIVNGIKVVHFHSPVALRNDSVHVIEVAPAQAVTVSSSIASGLLLLVQCEDVVHAHQLTFFHICLSVPRSYDSIP